MDPSLVVEAHAILHFRQEKLCAALLSQAGLTLRSQRKRNSADTLTRRLCRVDGFADARARISRSTFLWLHFGEL